MELYKNYLKEREGIELYYEEDGFITYIFMDDYCYIKDVYVVPEKRRSGKAIELGNKIIALAKERGYDKVMGSICRSTHGWQKSLQGMYKVGYVSKEVKDDMIYLIKEI